MESHQVAVKEQVELYLKPTKEHISHVTKLLFNKIKELRG